MSIVHRVKVREVMQLTGLSRATVDRVMNKRGGIHPATEQSVLEAIDRLRSEGPEIANDTDETALSPSIDALLRLDRGLTEQLLAFARDLRLPIDVQDLGGRDEDDILSAIQRACRDERPLLVTVKNREPLIEELVRARRRGKRVIAMVSDLNPDARDGYVGIDDRRAGRTAAYLLGFGRQRAKLAVVLGDHAFRCHEDREIGFRSDLRERFSNVEVIEVAIGDDSTERTRQAVQDLLDAHPDIDGIYNVSGGNDGLVEAVATRGMSDRVMVICHEANEITIPLVRRGLIHFLLSYDPSLLLRSAMEMAQTKSSDLDAAHKVIDFQILTPCNLPLV